MPPTIDLVRVNSRLTVFGLLGGTIVGGGIAAGVEFGVHQDVRLPGALFVVVAVIGRRRVPVDEDPALGRGHRR